MKFSKRIAIFCIGITLGILSCQSGKKEKKPEIKIGTKKEQLSPFDVGKTVFNGKGKCYTCHKVDKKSIGPSILEIMKVYNEEKGDIIAFLKQDAEPIVDPETYTVMKTNFAIIKTFTEEELQAVEVYMSEMSKKNK
ncbi:c-type cytochrome [Aquimarina sp. 2201CG1-2-11]|uniref:c-type cytochrome n=1 Tax=Aquimarina discodermiae TaxID=3231043 RepID=UPI0034632D33